MRLTIFQNALHFGMKCSKLRRQSQFRAKSACNFYDSHVYMRKTLKFTCTPAQSPPPQHLQHLDFFTSNMSHYLKSLKICPAWAPSYLATLLNLCNSVTCKHQQLLS